MKDMGIAGREEKLTENMVRRLMRMYNHKGFWGHDENNYYGQNWAWLGLFFVLENDAKNNG